MISTKNSMKKNKKNNKIVQNHKLINESYYLIVYIKHGID